MDISSAVKQVIKDTGFSMQRIANVMGITQQSVSSFVNRSRSMKVDNAVKVLDAMAYDLVIVPRGSRLPKGSIVVEANEDE